MKARVLIVDDKQEYLDDVSNNLRGSQRIEPIVAKGFKEAVALAKNHFITAAFVDLFIGSPEDPGEGDTLLTWLYKLRPTARRILCTEQTDEGKDRLMQSCNPETGAAHSIWLRGGNESLGEMISRYVDQQHLASTLDISPLEPIADSVIAKLNRLSKHHDRHSTGQTDHSASTTLEEVHYVISKLVQPADHSLRDQTPFRSVTEDEIERIGLIELGRGKSLSCVFKGYPITKRGDRGILCIIKVGPRSDVADELAAYERYVRFARHTFRRVEVLSGCLADTIGGICYSFAGPSPEEGAVESLQDVIERGDVARAGECLRMEMNPAQKQWYRKEGITRNTLTSYFSDTYRLQLPADVERLSRYAREFMENRAVGGLFINKPGVRQWYYPPAEGTNAHRVNLPRDSDIGHLNVEFGEFRSCVVHGDFNGENLIVARIPSASSGTEQPAFSNWAIPIDYRFTKRGPIFLDFAAMEATIRLRSADLQRCKKSEDFQEMVALASKEADVLRRAWISNVLYETERTGPIDETNVLWMDISVELVKLARANFQRPDMAVRDVKREYAATCFLYALRLLRIERLGQPNIFCARARLMVWISALLAVLRERSDGNNSRPS